MTDEELKAIEASRKFDDTVIALVAEVRQLKAREQSLQDDLAHELGGRLDEAFIRTALDYARLPSHGRILDVVAHAAEEVCRMRELIRDAECSGEGPRGYDCCPWCDMQTVADVEHNPNCPAFAADGSVR